MATTEQQLATPQVRRRKRRASFVERTIRGLAAAMERALYAEELAKADGLLQRLDPRVRYLGCWRWWSRWRWLAAFWFWT
jgi:hypothetical protein